MLKLCKKCNKNKEEICEFYFYKKENRYSSKCKACAKESQKIYIKNNYAAVMLKNKEWQSKNKENVRKIKARWKKNHPEYILKENKRRKEKIKLWRMKNKERLNKNKKDRKCRDLKYKIACYLRSRVSTALKNNYKAGSAVKDLGCSIEFLKAYFEQKFYANQETGKIMTWENYGEWHIDHVQPLSSFDLTNREQFLKACHYTNLQPLWAKENLSKGAKIIQ